MLFNSYFTGYTFSPDKVKTEVANLAQGWTQYANPMYVGAVPNVDQFFGNLSQKLKAAKVDKVTGGNPQAGGRVLGRQVR